MTRHVLKTEDQYRVLKSSKVGLHRGDVVADVVQLLLVLVDEVHVSVKRHLTDFLAHLGLHL